MVERGAARPRIYYLGTYALGQLNARSGGVEGRGSRCGTGTHTPTLGQWRDECLAYPPFALTFHFGMDLITPDRVCAPRGYTDMMCIVKTESCHSHLLRNLLNGSSCLPGFSLKENKEHASLRGSGLCCPWCPYISVRTDSTNSHFHFIKASKSGVRNFQWKALHTSSVSCLRK